MLKEVEKTGKYMNVNLAMAKTKRAKGEKRKEEFLTNCKEW